MNSVVDHERVWLEPAGAPDRCWCEDNQWGDDGVEYVRADLLERNTTRFPEHMARIVALKDTTLSERIQQLAEAIGLLPKHLHQYQWVADKKQAFGEKSVRSVAGDNGLGMGRQAIAVIPSHLTAVPEFIAAANPDTIAMLLSELLSERSARLTLARLLAEATGALEPFSAFADALNEEAPDTISIGIFADGAMRFGPSGGANLGSLRLARTTLSNIRGHNGK